MQLLNLIFANILLQPDLVQIAKFNDRQYFRIYGSPFTDGLVPRPNPHRIKWQLEVGLGMRLICWKCDNNELVTALCVHTFFVSHTPLQDASRLLCYFV